MDKEKKEELKKLFSIIDEKKFLRFAKSYAGKDEAFANAVFEHFMPEDKPIDYKQNIAECFSHKKKGRVAAWKLKYDWAVIRKESKRVMKQLQIMVDGSDYASAIDGALLFLETLCKYFGEDNFDYDYNTYEGKDFCNHTALSIVSELLLSEHAELTKPEKLQIVERLKRIDKKGVIDEYLNGHIGELVDKAQKKLLDDGQMLQALDEKIAAEKHDYMKAPLIIQKAELLNGMNRQDEAGKLIRQNLHIEAIRKYDLDKLIAERKYDEAERKCTAYLKEKGHSTQVWMEYKLVIGEETDNKEQMCTALQWLCVHANAYIETRMEYCTRLKSLCANEQWLVIREELIKEMVEETAHKEIGFWLLRQEGLNERLYSYISNLSFYSDYLDRTPGGEMLKYYALYSDAFTEEQQEALEKRIFDSIMKDAAHSNKEKEYYGIKYEIEKLSKVRPECHDKAVTLRDNLIRLYPRKPLFLSVLKELDL